MNLSEIRTDTRTIIAEVTAAQSYATDAQLNRFVNDGIKHMCSEAGVYEKTRSVTVATTVSAYQLPLEFISMKVVLNHNGIPLDPIVVSQIGSVFTTEGKPHYYYLTQTAFAPAVWAVATAYVTWPLTCIPTLTYIVPTTANGYLYECFTAGTSHAATEPTWLTVLGSVTAEGSGTATWKCRELLSVLRTLNLYATPTTAGGGVGTYTITYAAMDEGLYVDTDSPNFPSEKHHFLSLYTAFKVMMMEKNLQSALAFLSEYSAGLGLKIQTPGGGQQGAT